MDRKLDTGRIYKLLKTVVLAISAFFLIKGVYGVIIYPSFKTEMQRKNAECLAFINPIGCQNHLYRIAKQKNETDLYLKIGIALPVLFFGSNALLNYIAPKKEVKTNG